MCTILLALCMYSYLRHHATLCTKLCVRRQPVRIYSLLPNVYLGREYLYCATCCHDHQQLDQRRIDGRTGHTAAPQRTGDHPPANVGQTGSRIELRSLAREADLWPCMHAGGMTKSRARLPPRVHPSASIIHFPLSFPSVPALLLSDFSF
jgi:hypothetical protein